MLGVQALRDDAKVPVLLTSHTQPLEARSNDVQIGVGTPLPQKQRRKLVPTSRCLSLIWFMRMMLIGLVMITILILSAYMEASVSCHSLERKYTKASVRQYALLTVTQDLLAVKRGKQGTSMLQLGTNLSSTTV
jgi:hypothetical protein